MPIRGIGPYSAHCELTRHGGFRQDREDSFVAGVTTAINKGLIKSAVRKTEQPDASVKHLLESGARNKYFLLRFDGCHIGQCWVRERMRTDGDQVRDSQ